MPSGELAKRTMEMANEPKKESNYCFNLFGTSWGSILTAKAAKIVPELLDHVLVYGQVVKELAINEEVRQRQ